MHDGQAARRALAASSSGSSSCCGAVPEGDKALVFTQYTSFAGLVPHLAERLGKQVGFFHGSLNARQREELLTAFATPRRPGGARHLDPCRRPRPEPAGGEPRLPLRPLVEPRRRAAGDRPRRIASASSKPVFVHSLICLGHAGGADRPAARVEARARREGDGRRAARTGSAISISARSAPRSRWRRTPWRRRSVSSRIGTGPWARSLGAVLVPTTRRRRRSRRGAWRRVRSRTCAIERALITARVDGLHGDDHRAADPAAHLGGDGALRADHAALEKAVAASRSPCNSSTCSRRTGSEPLVPRRERCASRARATRMRTCTSRRRPARSPPRRHRAGQLLEWLVRCRRGSAARDSLRRRGRRSVAGRSSCRRFPDRTGGRHGFGAETVRRRAGSGPPTANSSRCSSGPIPLGVRGVTCRVVKESKAAGRAQAGVRTALLAGARAARSPPARRHRHVRRRDRGQRPKRSTRCAPSRRWTWRRSRGSTRCG